MPSAQHVCLLAALPAAPSACGALDRGRPFSLKGSMAGGKGSGTGAEREKHAATKRGRTLLLPCARPGTRFLCG
jgi:hypothetical protein